MAEPSKIALLNKYPMLAGVIDRLALTFVAYLAAKGVITSADIPLIGNYLGEILGGGLAIGIGMYQNRKVALAEAATTITPGTVVVTSATVAKATPQNQNIVSNAENAVVGTK